MQAVVVIQTSEEGLTGPPTLALGADKRKLQLIPRVKVYKKRPCGLRRLERPSVNTTRRIYEASLIVMLLKINRIQSKIQDKILNFDVLSVL